MARRPQVIRAWRWPEAGPAPTGQAAEVEHALDAELVRSLGALPVLLPLVERLGLRQTVNRHCHPAGTQAGAWDHGLVTLVLVLNRLLGPKPLVHVETWLAETVPPDLLGIDPAQGNDDRLARSLDALVPHLDTLWQEMILQAILAFDLDLSQLCYDLTSISFCGDYDQAELLQFGYSREHRPDRQPVELATTVTVAGKVPLDYRLLAGNVADRTTPVANLRRLQALLAALAERAPGRSRREPVVISDRAMLTLEAIQTYEQSGLRYLGPLDPSLGQGAVRRLLESVSAADLAAAPLAYRPQRVAADEPTWVPYQGILRELALADPHTPEQPPVHVRTLVVWSPSKARVDAQLRAAHLTKLETALTDLQGKLGRRPYTTRAAIDKRLQRLLARHPARRFLDVHLTEPPAVANAEGRSPVPAGSTTPFCLSWSRREADLAAAAAIDGRYAVGTNAPDLDPSAILTASKQRDVAEKRYEVVKGPLAVRPVFLHKEARIRALVFCTMVALLLFALVELLVQRAGLPGSATTVFQQFAPLAVLVLGFRDGSALRRLTGLTPPLTALLQTLALPPPERYLAAHP